MGKKIRHGLSGINERLTLDAISLTRNRTIKLVHRFHNSGANRGIIATAPDLLAADPSAQPPVFVTLCLKTAQGNNMWCHNERYPQVIDNNAVAPGLAAARLDHREAQAHENLLSQA